MTTTNPRRFFRYSLRTLMLLVTVFCVWMAFAAIRARDQRYAVEAILEAGGSVTYEHQIPRAKTEPPGPGWLRQLIGDEYFFTVIAVRLKGPAVDDAIFSAIKRFTDLRQLDLNNTKVSDAGLEHLNGLTSLDSLVVYRCPQITDAGLVHLKGLTNLRHLSFIYSSITDAGLVYLKGFSKLPILVLGGTQVTDAGLIHLEGLSNLKSLNLTYNLVTHQGLEKLQQALPSCKIRYTDTNGSPKQFQPAANLPTPQQ